MSYEEKTLEKLATVRDASDTIIIEPRFTVSNAHRRLAFHFTVSPDQIPPPSSNADRLAHFKRARAMGISDFRIAICEGKIIDAHAVALFIFLCRSVVAAIVNGRYRNICHCFHIF